MRYITQYLSVLDDPGLVFIGKPMCITGKGGVGTASNTIGLPVPFTKIYETPGRQTQQKGTHFTCVFTAKRWQK
jgi:hypothetical protein